MYLVLSFLVAPFLVTAVSVSAGSDAACPPCILARGAHKNA